MSNLANGPGHGTIDGVPFASSDIRLNQSGKAITKQTDKGTTFVPLPGSTTASISAPFAGNATPIDVGNLAARLTKKPFLFTCYWDDGAVVTMWAMLSGKSVSSSQAAGSDSTFELVCSADPFEA